MGLLAHSREHGSFWRVSEDPEKTERQVWGAAVRALRLRSGLTLHEAASAYEPDGFVPGGPDKGLSVQRWQQIEKGGLKFTPDQRKRLAKALDATPEGLELERARILGHRPRVAVTGMAEREPLGLVIPMWGRAELGKDGWKIKAAEPASPGLDLRDLLGPSIGVLRVVDGTMTGWAEDGDLVIFDRDRRPREGKGCVVETLTGDLYPRLFVGLDDDHALVRSMAHQKPVAFKRSEIKGVYAVRFRGE
jgi:hypothetical protein